MTSLSRFRKRLNKELSDQTIPDEIEVTDESQDDLLEEPVENTDEIVEEVIEPSEPVEFVVDPAILEEPKKEELVSIEQHLKNIDGMLKQELDDYALNYGIELDRRQTKPNMVNEFITKLKEKN